MRGTLASRVQGLGIRLAAALAATVLLATFALDADASKRKKYKTRIEISYVSTGEHRIVGDVDSRKGQCVRNRPVYLSVDGTVFTQATTGRRGGFEFAPPTQPPQSGVDYVVTARRKPIDNEGNPRPPIVCKRATSNTVTSP